MFKDRKELDYLHGRCHLFALAIQKVFGYDIEFAIDECDLELETEVLIHAYCVKEGKAVDVEGIWDKEDVLADFDYNEPYERIVTVKEVSEMMEDGFIEFAEIGELESLVKYIKDNKKRYQL